MKPVVKVAIIVSLFASVLRAQQTITFVQYMFNKAGMNPAASGTEISRKYYCAFGGGRQWIDLDNAPRTNFVNFSYTIRQPRSFSYWQNVGGYLDTENAGIMGNNGYYLTYAFHRLLKRKTVLSMGVFAGVRYYDRSLARFDRNDPAVSRSAQAVIVYPDIIPGVRLSGEKYFMDLSVRHVTINRIQDFRGNRIGSPTILFPSVFYSYGIKKPINDFTLMVPSLAVQVPLPGIPFVDGGVMFYLFNRLGLGVAARNISFASAIIQIRFLKDLTVGFAYSYPINDTRHVAPVSYELMFGLVPYGMDARPIGLQSIARCPTLSY